MKVIRFLLRMITRLSALMSKLRLLSPVYFNKYLQYCRLYGVRNATQLAFRKVWHGNPASKIDFTPLSVPDLRISCADESLPILDKQISVVIPTWNAGSDFPLLLRKLKSQKGLRECEIIIVDSGSSDDTLHIAREEGTEIVEIPSGSFDHAYARNKGAERATGDYVLFTVQDALPLTDRWLWELARVFEHNDVVAVSCAEYPRSDCDLFYRFMIWNHYRSLNLDRDRFLTWDDSCSTHLGLRSNGQISDLAALIRRDIFDKYKYKTKYAEDLDLGIRLIRDGHKIGFLYSTRVLHSHNRPPYYFLKRAYVDSKFQVEVFPDFVFPIVDNLQRLLQSIVSLYGRTTHIADRITNWNAELPIAGLLEQIRSLYSAERGEIQPQEGTIKDVAFAGFVRRLVQQMGTPPTAYTANDNLLTPHVLHHLGLLEAYVTQVHETADERLVRDLAAALYKIVALHSGAHIAYLYLTLSRRNAVESYLSEFDRTLRAGV